MFKRLAIFALSLLLFSSLALADSPAKDAPTAASSKKTAVKTKTAPETIKKGVSIDQLEGPRLAAAIGHFSRARSLLIAAVHEFDAGTRIGNPDLLINSTEWRKAVISQASELERVLSPQPAEPKGGVKYEGDSRLLTESKP